MSAFQYRVSRRSFGHLFCIGYAWEIMAENTPVVRLERISGSTIIRTAKSMCRARNKRIFGYDFRLGDDRPFLKQEFRFGFSLVDTGGLRYETQVRPPGLFTARSGLEGTVLHNDAAVLQLEARRYSSDWRALFQNGKTIEGSIRSQIDDPLTLAALLLALQLQLERYESE